MKSSAMIAFVATIRRWLRLRSPSDVAAVPMLVREPTAGEVLEADRLLGSPISHADVRARQIQLISVCSGLPISEVRQLPIATFTATWARLNRFLELPET